MKKFLSILVSLLIAAAPAFAWPTVYPRGTTLYDPQRAFNGYTLFSMISAVPLAKSSVLLLIDMNGQIVHQWKVPFSPVLQGRLLPNGNVVIIGQNDQAAPQRPGVGQRWMGGAAGWIVELDWDGKKVFEHVDLKMHHDCIKLPNGNYLYTAWEPVPKALQKKVRGGAIGTEHKDGTMFNDYLVEINPQGKTVWTWHANAHLNPDIDIIGPFYKREEWSHAGSVAMMQNGNILLASRHLDSMIVIDKKTGKIIFRWGNTAYLDKATGRLEYRIGENNLGGPHDAQEIAPGLLGSGLLLCYDNGTYADLSRVVAVDPVRRHVVRQWRAPKVLGRNHFSSFLGGAQMLPNGNMLICDGANGRFFQLTDDNKMVWEYVNPYTMTTPDFRGAVYKIHHYAPDYCPQFKALPAAAGPAVVPKADEFPAAEAAMVVAPQLVPQDTPATQQAVAQPRLQNVLALLVALAASAGLGFFWGRRVPGKR